MIGERFHVLSRSSFVSALIGIVRRDNPSLRQLPSTSSNGATGIPIDGERG